MKTAIIQPEYPANGTFEAAAACFEWIKLQLEGLDGKDVELVVLPEFSNCPGLNDADSISRFINAQGKTFLAELSQYADNLQCIVIAGTVQEDTGRMFNRTIVFGRTGELVYQYDKIHLTAAEKAIGLEAGSKPGILEISGIKIGFATCFDIYFSEYFEALAVEKPDLIVCPSYQRGEDMFRIDAMTRTRAIDSGAWILRSSYSMGENVSTGGKSMLISPSGKVIADAEGEVKSVITEFNPAEKYRKAACFGGPQVIHRENVAAHRRPGAYHPVADKLKKYREAAFPRLCAHRGLSFAMPENTVPAFAAAIATGAHEIELDLWLSADEVPVVCHDPDLKRVAGVDAMVQEMNWRELKKLDPGSFKGEQWSGIKIACFDDILALADGHFGINIHIKDPGPDGKLVRVVGDSLRERCLLDCAYISGDRDVQEAAIDLAPGIDRCCLVEQRKPDILVAAALEYGCKRIQFFPGFTAKHIATAKEAGIICNLFHSDDYEEAVNYCNDGIDVILTNVAHKLISLGFNSTL